MVKNYRKGYSAELSLTHALAKNGYMAVRTPRSGRIGLPSPDVIAARSGRLIVIECKSRASAFTVPAEQLEELRQWRDRAGAAAYIGWKIARKGWTFITLDDAIANKGNIGKRFAMEKGMSMEML